MQADPVEGERDELWAAGAPPAFERLILEVAPRRGDDGRITEL